MPVGATHPMHSSNGHIGRIYWDDSFSPVYTNFYHLMREEANPVNQQRSNRINPLRYVYFWEGAVITYGVKKNPKKGVIEVQHQDKETLDALTNILISEISKGTRAKFHRKTIIGELERAERRGD